MGVALGDPFRPPIRRVDVGLPVGVVLGGRGVLLVFPFQALAEMRGPLSNLFEQVPIGKCAPGAVLVEQVGRLAGIVPPASSSMLSGVQMSSP